MRESLLFEEAALETPFPAVHPDQAHQLHAIGADYIADFISEPEEQKLLTRIRSEPWQHDLRRRVQHYGYRYNYKARGISHEDRIRALPAWVDMITQRLMARGVFEERPDQMIVNEYEPGQGIAPHTDRACFGPVLASLSLGGACVMHLAPSRRLGDQKGFDIVLEPRSLTVYTGVSRAKWKHGIAARQNDKIGNRVYPRKLRISLTFRTVPLPA